MYLNYIIIYTMSVASVYPLYVTKAERKDRAKTEVDEIIRWLTGYSQEELEMQLKKQTDFETFFVEAPKLNPSRTLIKGVVCGVRVEDVEEPTMREIRYLDKLIDETHQGKGYGSEAVKLCIDYIKSKPFGKSNDIILTCNTNNTHAIHIYEKLGFKDTGERDEDEIIMRLVI
jgi:hypothetical protein